MELGMVVRDAISVLTFISHIGIVLFIVLFIFQKPLKKLYVPIITFFKKNALLFGFIVAIIGTISSLFYSLGLGWDPCELCWYQRIFMYPLVLLFGLALWKKKKDIFLYTIPMGIIGAVIAMYHYISQWRGVSGTCTNGISCSFKYITSFEYITIPLMAFTGFAMILFFSWLLWKKK